MSEVQKHRYTLAEQHISTISSTINKKNKEVTKKKKNQVRLLIVAGL